MNYSDIIVSPSLRPKLTRSENVINSSQYEHNIKILVGDLETKGSKVAVPPSSRRPKMNRCEIRLNSLHDECDNKISVVDRFPMKERLQPKNNVVVKEKLTLLRAPSSMDKLHIGIALPSGSKQHSRWLQHVKRLKYGQKSTQLHLPGTLDVKLKKLKPFGNFVSSKLHATKNVEQDKIDKVQRVEMSGARHVTFNIDNSSNQGPGISMHTTTSATTKSTQSSNTSHKKTSSSSLLATLDHSHHKCARVQSRLLDKRTTERCFWTRKSIERTKSRSRHRANTFRVDYPATVKQLSKIFLDTCNKNSTYNKDSVYGDDEDQEEMLRDFLRDWAASNVRGLEELVTGRNMFTDTRKMAVQSVLAYQQTLRENMCPTEVDRMADLLRARSESTSQRARIFAMYLALGDALVANSNNNDEHDFDDAELSIHME